MTEPDPYAPRYPEGTRLASYRWHDPHGRLGISQGPVIEMRVWLDPQMPSPERLEWELHAGLAQLLHHINKEIQ